MVLRLVSYGVVYEPLWCGFYKPPSRILLMGSVKTIGIREIKQYFRQYIEKKALMSRGNVFTFMPSKALDDFNEEYILYGANAIGKGILSNFNSAWECMKRRSIEYKEKPLKFIVEKDKYRDLIECLA